MGVSYKASVICGYPAEVKSVVEDIVKYDEDTGKPYTTSKHSHDELIIAGSSLSSGEEYYDGEKFFGLELIQDGGDFYLGVRIAEVEANVTWSKPIDYAIPEPVEKFSREHGLTPQFLLIMTAD